MSDNDGALLELISLRPRGMQLPQQQQRQQRCPCKENNLDLAARDHAVLRTHPHLLDDVAG